MIVCVSLHFPPFIHNNEIHIKSYNFLWNYSKKRQELDRILFYHNTYKAGEQRWKAMKHKFKGQLIILRKM